MKSVLFTISECGTGKDGSNILGCITQLTSISTDLKIAKSAVLETFEIMHVLSMGKHSVLNN